MSTTTLTHFQDFSYNPFFCFRILEPPHASFLHNSVFTGEFPSPFHLNVPTIKLMGNKKGKILYKADNFLWQKIYTCHFIFFQASPLPFLNMFCFSYALFTISVINLGSRHSFALFYQPYSYPY